MRVCLAVVAIVAAALTASAPAAQAPLQRRVAVTIDDLPRGGDGSAPTFEAVRTMNERLVRPFRQAGIPFTGFVNEGRASILGEGDLRRILDIWLDAGADLGNHSYSHYDINQVPLAQYTADIVKGEPVIRAALAARGKTLRYFRHPFLHAGPTSEIKQGLQAFLDQHGYRVAPVTLDNSDYVYAALYTRTAYREQVRREYVSYMESVVAFFEARSVEVAGREFPQVLLLHDNQLNAELMPELLAMFRGRGYAFVTLDEALADPVYTLPEGYVGRNGFSWLHRWSQTKGMPNRGEPDPPAWVATAYSNR